MLLTDRKEIDDLMRDNFRWLGIPAIERTAKGRLFLSWYTCGNTEEYGNYVPLIWSDDDGATWRPSSPRYTSAPMPGPLTNACGSTRRAGCGLFILYSRKPRCGPACAMIPAPRSLHGVNR